MVINNVMAQTNAARFRLMTLDPGHFHASLVQKFSYADVDPVVHVYAPEGDDLSEHLKRIERFNTRADQPTHWKEEVYSQPDFFEKMLADKPGNVVVLAGKSAKKADYILRSVQDGLNVLAQAWTNRWWCVRRICRDWNRRSRWRLRITCCSTTS